MRNTIFAPTHGYKRRPDDVTITDTIKDLSDPNTVITRDKLAAIMPGNTSKAPKNTVFKNYTNLKVIHDGSADADKKARDYFVFRELTAFKNGVGLVDADNPTRNLRYLKGMTKFD
jgi:hypothetical protein